jgi:Peptidase family M13
MQPPVYYGPRLPQYLTYGAFGALMGHEISHGILCPYSHSSPGLLTQQLLIQWVGSLTQKAT